MNAPVTSNIGRRGETPLLRFTDRINVNKAVSGLTHQAETTKASASSRIRLTAEIRQVLCQRSEESVPECFAYDSRVGVRSPIVEISVTTIESSDKMNASTGQRWIALRE